MMTRTHLHSSEEQGSILVSIIIVAIFLTFIVSSLMVLANANLSRSKGRIYLLQAQYAAESGADAALAQLNSGNDTYTGTTTDVQMFSYSQYKSTYAVTVAAGSTGKEKVITATGKVYVPSTAASPRMVRKIEVLANRTSSSTTSSVVSRNVIQIDSGVKNLQAKDLFVNGYITMAKNTTNLIGENITVAGKNTGATNCSIGGTGNLVKPSSFHTAGQTKTNLTMAFNNCINPPGNTSNASFNILANQTNISKIQSTYIAWSQYMDSSYQSSPGGCNDWISGASPRSIPSTGNTKKTHYPDTGSNVVSSCGTNGNIDLGSNTYTIRDNAHIRANLCSVTACTPTFNNPDATIKFIFVEGRINFDNVITSPTSGPIVFVTYGADSGTRTGSCPLGDSVYIGKATGSLSVNAPDAYFLASNGVCLDATKFGSANALGGLSGKNIYIATNSGTPFDLAMDPLFPTDQIPVDLAWRAGRYRRL